MTARDDLYDALVVGDGRPETLLRAEQLLNAYRDEVLRVAGRSLRDCDVPYVGHYQLGWRDAAEALLKLADG